MSKIININCNEDINFNRLKYTIDFIDNHPLKPSEIQFVLNKPEDDRIDILYSKTQNEGLFIPLQNIFFSNDSGIRKHYINRYKYKDNIVYSVEDNQKEDGIFVEDKAYKFDIFETIFYHISRYEEVNCNNNQLDIHKRMKSGEQLLYRYNIHHSPVVDLLVLNFFKSLGFSVKQRKTTYSLTHDIDIIQKYKNIYSSIKSIAKSIQMGLGISGSIRIIKSIINSIGNPQKDPYYTYDWLFTENPDFLKKIVYFVAGGSRKYDLYDKYYLKELPLILAKARNKSYNIGYHPSYDAFDDKSLFEQEYNTLNSLNQEKILDVRTHYLRLDIQKTFELFEEFGLEYDSTLGYSDDIGFRCGTGFEYYPYNFKEERAWKFKEIPLVFMDSSLIYNVCNDNVKCFEEKAKQFFEKNKFNTHIMINFHNSTFDYSLKSREGLKEVYLELVNKILS